MSQLRQEESRPKPGLLCQERDSPRVTGGSKKVTRLFCRHQTPSIKRSLRLLQVLAKRTRGKKGSKNTARSSPRYNFLFDEDISPIDCSSHCSSSSFGEIQQGVRGCWKLPNQIRPSPLPAGQTRLNMHRQSQNWHRAETAQPKPNLTKQAKTENDSSNRGSPSLSRASTLKM